MNEQHDQQHKKHNVKWLSVQNQSRPEDATAPLLLIAGHQFDASFPGKLWE